MESIELINGRGIKNIFVDFGVVLVNLAVEKSEKMFSEIGIDAKLDGHRQSGIFLDIDTGLLDEKKFAEELSKTSSKPEKATYEKIFAAHIAIHDSIPKYKLDFLARLKREGKYKLFGASNMSKEGWNWCKANGFCLNGRSPKDFFDDVFISFDLKAAKPDLKFFEEAVARSGADPKESFLIDDSDNNCKAAQSMGFRTHSPLPRQNWLRDVFKF